MGQGQRCQSEPKTLSEKDDVRTVEYAPAAAGGPSVTVLYLLGHGHAWPGGQESGLPERVLGPNTAKLNATDAIWDFFNRQR